MDRNSKDYCFQPEETGPVLLREVLKNLDLPTWSVGRAIREVPSHLILACTGHKDILQELSPLLSQTGYGTSQLLCLRCHGWHLEWGPPYSTPSLYPCPHLSTPLWAAQPRSHPVLVPGPGFEFLSLCGPFPGIRTESFKA